ncbi:hypothetical protein [Emcibacter nanhaiensis]|uniref:Uncharacterized protein n=1 Tax=Emcibacter nanhaiensis TaxID=1505037 RepID=A0A501PNH9_9PROT|nr:hypothetical protein [Emcibacter nanhaiensis]TPD61718.1 hypothetical protein FIV46_05785 [Emcibacter nanhaiensis]
MADIIKLPDNLISNDDRQKLESYGAHEIARGRATRFHWTESEQGDPLFEIYRGGAVEELVLQIGRHREQDEYYALDPSGQDLTSGSLDHVMAQLDRKLAWDHGES